MADIQKSKVGFKEKVIELLSPSKNNSLVQPPVIDDEEENPYGPDYLPNGLPKNYASMTKPGDPDGNDPENPVIIYADGCFDMYHLGHAKVFEQCKKMYPHVYLIVGVASDEEIKLHKGQNVMDENERSNIIRHCKWVDEVIMPCPWVLTLDFLKEKGIHYVAHDDIPYTSGGGGAKDIYYNVKKHGFWRTTYRTQGVSTSDIVLRIIKNYNNYIERSLKRDFSPSDLNISQFKALRVRLALKLDREWKKRILNPGSMWSDFVKKFQKYEYKLQDIWDEYINPESFNKVALEACRRVGGKSRLYEDDEDKDEGDGFMLRREKSLRDSFYQYVIQKKKLKMDDEGIEILESQEEYGDEFGESDQEENPEDQIQDQIYSSSLVNNKERKRDRKAKQKQGGFIYD